MARRSCSSRGGLGRGRLARRRPGAARPCTPSPPAPSAISADSLDERIALGGPRDELRELADTFDALLDRVQQTVSSERRLVATMSHELRTPLANQQAALDVALADPDADARRAARRGGRPPSTRAAGRPGPSTRCSCSPAPSRGEPAGTEPVDLRAPVAEAVDQVRDRDDGAAPGTSHLAPVTVPGEPVLLDRAVAQPRAQRRAPQRARAGAGRRPPATVAGDRASLVVENTGPPVPPTRPPTSSCRSGAASADRTAPTAGVGLGLTVVRAVADHHGGRLALTPLEPGGLAVELVLPPSTAVERAHGVVGPGN